MNAHSHTLAQSFFARSLLSIRLTKPGIAVSKAMMAGVGVLVSPNPGALIATLLAPSLLPIDNAPEFVLSLKYRPDVSELCRPATEEEMSKMMRHMKSETICERKHPDVRVEIFFDGATVHEGTYRAHGLSSDGPSFAIVRLPAHAEKHLVQVYVGHVGNPEWTHTFKHQVGFPDGRVQVVDFDEGRWTPHFSQEN